ncbi:MAG: AAA family ATPase, partial [Sphaerochaetaceae bacterium]|nr:AAA family ATPase [Sphaerochaetaceae bacterium]
MITGETGAGKSIILGALGLLMGEKADSSAVRTGTEELSVNAVVSIPEGHEIVQWLDEHGISSEDGTVIVRRSVKSNGRSLISVQGQIITRAELSFFADSLIDMHGQSEHQSLLLQDRQRKTVDSYSHSEALLQRCAAAYHTLSELQKEKEELRKAVEESRKQTDYLEFAVKEIKAVSPEPGEDDELKERVELLSSYEAVYESVSQGMDRLKEAKSALYDCCSLLDRALKKDSGISDYRDRIENVSIEVEDVTSSL